MATDNGSGTKEPGTVNVVFKTFDPNPSGKFAHDVLSGAHVTGVLIGRLAVWYWIPNPSEHAYTKDLDIAVTRESLQKVRAWLNEHAHETRELPIGGINVASSDQSINVDFIHRGDKDMGDLAALFEDAIRTALELGRTAQVGGEALLVVPVEHLVMMKMATMERKDEEDAERLLEYASVDIEKLRGHVATFLGPLGPPRLENLLRTVGHPKARPRQKYNGKGS